jgi:VCBS repeat-containing protein
VADSSPFVVSFFEFAATIPYGTVSVPGLAAGQTAEVSIQTSFASSGLRMITVKVDPDDEILELNEHNNEASAVLQVGEPTGSDEAEIVVSVPAQTAYQGRPVAIGGRADYDFLMTPQSPDYPVQGAQVTVTVIDAGQRVLGVYTGAKTEVGGNFWQGIWAPMDVGIYTLRVTVTDNTVTGQFDSTLNVIVEPTLPPIPPPLPPSGPARDVSVYSDNIFFSTENPDLGEPITIFAFVGYVGEQAAEDVQVTINDIFPVGGSLRTFPIGSTLVDFPASPDGAMVAVTLPWTNTADGAHIIQAVAQPVFPQYTGNDRATRLISVGSTVQTLTIEKSVLLVDTDGDGKATPGDTLAYTITYENTGRTELTGVVLLDDYDELLLQTPFDISDGGVVENDSVLWDLGPLAAGASGSVSYLIQIKPADQFPGGMVTVLNTALLDTQQTAPVAATAEIVVTGDMIPPTTTATVTPTPNAAGWNKNDVQLILTAADNEGGSGVAKILYAIDGGEWMTVPGNTITLPFTEEGIRAVTFYAVDVALNAESPQTIDIKIDKTAPTPVHDGPFVVNEGSSVGLDGTHSTDVLSGVASTAWDLDGDGLFDDGDPASFVALDGPATYDVCLKVSDKAGNTVLATTHVTVNNVAPSVEAHEATVTVDEGQTATNTGTFADPGVDTVSLAASIGTIVDNGDGTWSWSFATSDGPDDSQTVIITATDSDGAVTNTMFALVVNNVAPSVGDDAYEMAEDGVLGVAATGVLANDTDVPCDPLIAVLVAGPSHGQLVLNANGSFTYLPNEDFNGNDTFTYKANDGNDDSSVATVTITVNPVNDRPVACGQTVTVTEDGKVSFALHGSDVETAEANLTFTITSVPARGVFKDAAGNEVTAGQQFIGAPTLSFEPGASCDMLGTFPLEFTVTDRGDPDTPGTVGLTSDPAAVAINVVAAVGEGTATLDGGILRIGGTSGDDSIVVARRCGGGNLTVLLNNQVVCDIPAAQVSEVRIWGRGGNDAISLVDLALLSLIHGGDGNDVLTGGAGNDLIFGGRGDDTIVGAAGDDFLVGGYGADRIVGSAGNDILVAGHVTCGYTRDDLREIGRAWAKSQAVDAAFDDDVLDETLAAGGFDMLTGSAGADWFIIGEGDKITDLQGNKKDGDVVTVV